MVHLINEFQLYDHISTDLAEFLFMGFKLLFTTILRCRSFDQEQEDNASIGVQFDLM